MSQDNTNANSNQGEEIDLGHLFNAIGRFFKTIYSFFENLFNFLFIKVIIGLKAIIDNFKLISVVFLASMLLGVVAEKINPQTYYSNILLKPYFDTKYQLVSNISYYNALISDNNYDVLSELFDLTEEEAKSLVNFEIQPGPETENEKMRQYDEFIKSIDSLRAQDVSYEDFVENRNIYNGELFLVEVNSTQKDVFENLESGFYSTFENEYSKMRMKKRDLSIELKKNALEQSIRRIDTLKEFYLNLKKLEIESNANSVSISEAFLPVQKEKIETKEFELLNTERFLRDSIVKLDELKAVENVYFDVVSDFQVIGTKSDEISKKYSLLFPLMSMLLLIMAYLTFHLVKYVREYK